MTDYSIRDSALAETAKLIDRYAVDSPESRNGPEIVSIIIVNYNSGEYLAQCAAALTKQTYSSFRVIIVDNNSEDRGWVDVAASDNRFRILFLNKNLGFAAGNNIGAYLEPAQFIVTLNADAFPEPEWLETLIACAMKSSPDIVAFGSTQLLDGDVNLFDGIGDQYYFAGYPWRSGFCQPVMSLPDEYETFSVCAAAALYRSDAFWEEGGFDSSFFCYCEDVDLGFRMRLAGRHCLQVSRARVRHVGGGSSSKISGLSERLGSRNTLWTLIKNMPFPFLTVAVLSHFVIEIFFQAVGLIYYDRKIMTFKQRVEQLRYRREGIIEAVSRIADSIKQRQLLQNRRKASTISIARFITWNPLAFLRRRELSGFK